MIIPVIMCGGSGTRLWPQSRDEMPKQFMPLFTARSTFQDTLARLDVPDLFDKPIVITNERFRFIVAEQARAIGIDCEIILEPIARDSAPAVAVSALRAFARDATTTALILAADHAIADVATFHNICRQADDVTKQGKIVTFGIEPTYPATGYGYLKPGAAIANTQAFQLSSFVEKPDAATAKSYLTNGYLWNSGNFMFQANDMIDELNVHAPAILSAAQAAISNGQQDQDFLRLAENEFKKAQKISIDYAVMEKTERASVIPASMGWSDIGSWDAVWTLSDKDTEGNATTGHAICIDSQNCLVRSPDTIVTAVSGLDNVVVVTTPDAVLVTTRDKSESVKQVLAAIKEKRAG
ncbi:MAG: mannose-1-phosphate guanylyltransferase/mannose-6-phosphate isomerase [Hyphomicrobiaceae bacterium]